MEPDVSKFINEYEELCVKHGLYIAPTIENLGIFPLDNEFQEYLFAWRDELRRNS